MASPAPTKSAAISLAGLLVVAATLVLLVDRHAPAGAVLLLRSLRAAALAGLFGLSALAGGLYVHDRLGSPTAPPGERLALALPLGIGAFFFVSFAFGLVGAYGPTFFVAAPAILLALGRRELAKMLAQLRRLVGAKVRGLRPAEVAVIVVGALAIGWLWLGVLTPRNASYDARWYHLPLAEHYVAAGGLTVFREGWIAGTQPQLASLLYAWAFCFPGALYDKMQIAGHVELVTFAATLLGVSAAARRASGERLGWAWVVVFCFPGIFCYDAGLHVAADHVAAVFAIPLYLAALRHDETPTVRSAALLGLLAGLVVCTKYTAYILLPLPLFFALRGAAKDGRRGLGPLAAFAAVFLVAGAPHWARNVVHHGDPFYPILRGILPSHPWGPEVEGPHTQWFRLYRPPFSVSGLVEMAKTLVTFSFVPHDFPQYHGETPVFGSLFTAFTPLALAHAARRRLLVLFVAAYAGIAAWFWIHQLDRYLQVLVPWMAAGTAVALRLAWRGGALLRLGATLAVAVQAAWAVFVPTLPSHLMAGGSAQRAAVESWVTHRHGDPVVAISEWEAMARALPRGAKVLVHEEELHLGLGTQTVLDYAGDQAVFYWGDVGRATPREIHATLRAHGVTHLLWADRIDHGSDTLAGAFAFFDFAKHDTEVVGTYGGFVVARLRDVPREVPAGEVGYHPCTVTEPFEEGLYALGEVARSKGDPRPIARPRAKDVATSLARARFLAIDARCHPMGDAHGAFELLAARGSLMLFVRKGHE